MSDTGPAGAQASVTESVADGKTAIAAKDESKVAAAEVETEEAEAETTDEPVEGAEVVETEEEKKTKSKLRREKQQAREAALKQRVADLEAQLATADRTKPAADGLGPKPDRAKYEDEADYAADLAAWKIEERIIARQTKAHESTTQNLRNDTAAKKMELFKERAMALQDRYPDIEKVFTDASLPMSTAMAETLMESDKGPEVAHYLLANREVAQRIKEMPPLTAARELGRIEATISLPKPRTETKAPPPPTVVTGSGVSSPRKTTDSSGDGLSTEEWVKRERARLAAKK
jgi:hypothetical protein